MSLDPTLLDTAVATFPEFLLEASILFSAAAARFSLSMACTFFKSCVTNKQMSI